MTPPNIMRLTETRYEGKPFLMGFETVARMWWIDLTSIARALRTTYPDMLLERAYQQPDGTNLIQLVTDGWLGGACQRRMRFINPDGLEIVCRCYGARGEQLWRYVTSDKTGYGLALQRQGEKNE